jgi:hypothetical protein
MEEKIIDFWKNIIYTNGKIDEEKAMKELSDYYFMLDQVPKVYMAVSGGELSKPNYYADTIIDFLEDRYFDKEITQDDISSILDEEETTSDEKLKEIKEYLEIQ